MRLGTHRTLKVNRQKGSVQIPRNEVAYEVGLAPAFRLQSLLLASKTNITWGRPFRHVCQTVASLYPAPHKHSKKKNSWVTKVTKMGSAAWGQGPHTKKPTWRAQRARNGGLSLPSATQTFRKKNNSKRFACPADPLLPQGNTI